MIGIPPQSDAAQISSEDTEETTEKPKNTPTKEDDDEGQITLF